MTDRHTLRWTAAPEAENLTPLPAGITRHFITTPCGKLELLVALPPSSSSPSPSPSPSTTLPREKALLFVHGGFGCAATRLPTLTLLSQTHRRRCYALSLRGHGASWKPGFAEMVFRTGAGRMLDDLGFAMARVHGLESASRAAAGGCGSRGGAEVVLVGHSAGGGLVQSFLSRNRGGVAGLVVVAGFPCFGGLPVYRNWFKLDPWFPPRFYLRDFWHPRSPLSSTTLVHRAFFSPVFPVQRVRKFEPLMPEYESLVWPMSMMFPFVNVRNVWKNITGWGDEHGQQRLLVIAGEKDTLMGVTLMRKMAMLYRQGFAFLVKTLFFSEKFAFDRQNSDTPVEDIDEGIERVSDGVRFAIIAGSGHHIQNDLQWETCALRILDFVNQL